MLALAAKIELRPRPADRERVDLEVAQEGRTMKESGIENDTLRPTTEKVVAKFRRLAGGVRGADAERILEAVMGLDGAADVGSLTRLLRPARG